MVKVSKQRLSAGRTGKPNAVDVHVGGRMRLRRTLLGLTFQQVQKYGRGTNSVGASRLFDLSGVLDAPVSYFFEETSSKVAKQSPRLAIGLAETPTGSCQPDPMAKRETLELVRSYYKIASPSVRKRVFELTKALAKASSPE
jgi:transcriptional regulator with XRE-family HTH domain